MSCNSYVCSPFCTEVYSSIKQSTQKAAALGFQQDSWSAMSKSGDELVPDSLDAGEPLKVSPAGVSKAMSSIAPIKPGSSTQSPVPPSPINEDGEFLKSAHSGTQEALNTGEPPSGIGLREVYPKTQTLVESSVKEFSFSLS